MLLQVNQRANINSGIEQATTRATCSVCQESILLPTAHTRVQVTKCAMQMPTNCRVSVCADRAQMSITLWAAHRIPVEAFRPRIFSFPQVQSKCNINTVFGHITSDSMWEPRVDHAIKALDA